MIPLDSPELQVVEQTWFYVLVSLTTSVVDNLPGIANDNRRHSIIVAGAGEPTTS